MAARSRSQLPPAFRRLLRSAFRVEIIGLVRSEVTNLSSPHSIRKIARGGRKKHLQKGGESVRFVRYFCRADEATGMPPCDPKLYSSIAEERHHALRFGGAPTSRPVSRKTCRTMVTGECLARDAMRRPDERSAGSESRKPSRSWASVCCRDTKRKGGQHMK
jgi:hypothetical protein